MEATDLDPEAAAHALFEGGVTVSLANPAQAKDCAPSRAVHPPLYSAKFKRRSMRSTRSARGSSPVGYYQAVYHECARCSSPSPDRRCSAAGG